MNKIKKIEELIDKAKKYIEEKDVGQSCEKIYKAVEECIKLIAEKEKISEFKKSKREGRWLSHLLSNASFTLAEKLKEDKISDVWAIAFNLHVWGFHENRIKIKMVKRELPKIQWLIYYTKNYINSKNEKNISAIKSM